MNTKMTRIVRKLNYNVNNDRLSELRIIRHTCKSKGLLVYRLIYDYNLWMIPIIQNCSFV